MVVAQILIHLDPCPLIRSTTAPVLPVRLADIVPLRSRVLCVPWVSSADQVLESVVWVIVKRLGPLHWLVHLGRDISHGLVI